MEGRLPAAASLFLHAVLALSLLGCAGQIPPVDFTPPAVERRIADVPFHRQLRDHCGPVSLAATLNFLGDPITPEQVAADVFREDLSGTTNLDMALYPRRRGFATRFFAGDPDDLLRAVNEGRPRIVMLDRGLGPVRVNHFVVVVGYAPDAVLLHDGVNAYAPMAWDTFLQQWGRAKFWTLDIRPKE